MMGLHDLQYTFDESDESVVARWVENPYWPSFCGDTHMQHECPIHPTSMTKWRNRVGVERLEELLKETIAPAVRMHWAIENSLHWVLDVIFNEDQIRTRKWHIADNLSWLRRFAIGLLKRYPSDDSIKGKSRTDLERLRRRQHLR